MKKLILAMILIWSCLAIAQGTEPQKQTIQQIKQVAQPIGFQQWAATFTGSVEGQILKWVWLIIIAGMFASYLTKWAFKVVDKRVSPIDYFWRQDPQRTLGAFLGAYGFIAGGAFTGAFSNDVGEFVGWYNVVYATFMTALASDGGINKGSRPAWTAEERTMRSTGAAP